ncbi:MAG: hypothetical protein AAB817_03270 [Patescibacteria group bacterium]
MSKRFVILALLAVAAGTVVIFFGTNYFLSAYEQSLPKDPVTLADERFEKCLQSSSVQMIVKQYEINKVSICNVETVDRKVDFVNLGIGDGQDCLAGCFYSHFCAIIDRKKVYPFGFSFYGGVGKIVDNLGIKREDRFASFNSQYYREYYGNGVLKGRDHPIVSSENFRKNINRLAHGCP